MKLVLKNLFSLGFIQAIGVFIPIILTPYLIKVVGIAMFGVIVTAQGFVLLFNILTDFGFNITAVRRIAQANGDAATTEKIINSVFFLKCLLVIVAFLLFLLCISLVPHFRQHFFIYLFSFSMVAGQAFLPVWYYQGIEKVAKTLLPVFLGKLLSMAAIFFFINTMSDAVYVNLLYGLGSLLPGLFLHIAMAARYRIRFKNTNAGILKKEVKDNLPVFLSNTGVLIYSNSSTLILSFFVLPEVVGIYNVAEKIIQLGKTMLIMIHQVTYPRLCSIIRQSHQSAFLFLKRMYVLVWAGMLCICIFLFFFPATAVSFFITNQGQLAEASRILKTLSLLLFIIALNMPFYQSLLAFHKDWITVRVMLSCSVISLLMNLLLIPVFNINGLVITMYAAEIYVTALFIYLMLQQKKKLYVN